LSLGSRERRDHAHEAEPVMRAPIEKFAYGDREWAAIRDLFAEIDIDAGQVNIREDEHGNYIVVPPGLARWQLDLMAPRSLRRALDSTARHCIRLRGEKDLSLTPKRRAEQLKKVIAACEGAPRVMDYDEDFDDALNVLVLKMQAQHDRLVALGRMNQNARKIWRDAFWFDLLRLWNAVTSKKKPPRKIVISFLVLCSTPVFSTKTKAIEYFLDKQPKSKA
jgi:hypothetical protein